MIRFDPMPKRKLTPELFDEMLASYEAWDSNVEAIDDWAARWPVSKATFFNAMRDRGVLPKSQRPGNGGNPTVPPATPEMVTAWMEMLVDARVRIRMLEQRLKDHNLPID